MNVNLERKQERQMGDTRVVLMVADDADELPQIGAVLQVLSEVLRGAGEDWLSGSEHEKILVPMSDADVKRIENAAERLIAIWRGKSDCVSFPLGVGSREANDV